MNRKILTGLSFLLLLSNADAYKILQEYLDLDNDPSTAKTLATGKITENIWGTQFFVGERGWTFFPTRFEVKKIYIPNEDSSTKRGIVGESYLFYSIEKTNINGELNSSSYIGLITLKSLKAKEVITKLASKKDFVGEINPSWQFCESDKECIQSKKQCGKPIGVNKNYQKDYLDFLKTKKIKIECSKNNSVQTGKPSISKCVENFCS